MRLGVLMGLAFVLFSCGGEEKVKEPKQTKTELPELLGGTDSFFVRTQKREKVTLVGRKIRTKYSSFNTNREANFGFISSVLKRLNENKQNLLGPVHLVMLETPKEDSMDYFVGLPVSGTKGFIENEIYTIPALRFFTAKTGKPAGLALGRHKELQVFLTENGYAFKAPIIEVWKEQMERDMTKHENIQLMYSIK